MQSFLKLVFRMRRKTFNDHDTKDQDIAFGVIRFIVDGNKEVRLKGKVDTGAQINIMNLMTCKNIFGKEYKKLLKGSKLKLHGYGGKPFKNHGVIHTTVRHKNVTGRNVKFYVTEHGSNLFSLNLCKKLKMVEMRCDECNDCTKAYDVCEAKTADHKFNEVEDLTNTFPDVFDGVGCLKGYEVKLQVDPDVTPVQSPPRHFTDDIAQRMKTATDNMLNEDVIKRHQGYTEWVSPVQPVIKPSGEIRVCQDFRELNKAILAPKYYTKTLEEVLPCLKKCKYFSTLDQSHGYWNIKVAEESQHLLAFTTPDGIFLSTRLPMGLKCSQAYFQMAVDHTFGDLQHTYCIADDVLIATETREEHDRALTNLMERMQRISIQTDL